MAIRSFQTKLLYLVIATLLLLQTATLVSVHFAGRRTLRDSVTEELKVGTRVFQRVLTTRAGQLSDSLRLLASDFAFREAIAFSDLPTIHSVLVNHGARVSADVVTLVALDGIVISDTRENRTGTAFPHVELLRQAEERGGARAVIALGGRPFQLIMVPVLAPQPIAWVCAGFAIDEATLADVKRLTSLEVSIRGESNESLLISTLPGNERAEMLAAIRTLPYSGQTTMELGSAPYATYSQPIQIGEGSRVHLVVQRSLEEASRLFRQLELQIFALSTIALVAAVFAAVIFSQQVARPLLTLTRAAGRIGAGDYVSEVNVEREDEFGQLATAFNQMRSAIAAREEQIIHQATHDALTALPNRTLFMDRLAHSIAEARRSGESVGMVIMDVDRFKEINDTLGHAVGDQLLIELSHRLKETARESDTVARLGGDEFAVECRSRDIDHAIAFAERLGQVFAVPVVLGEVTIDVAASMGIATFPAHADDAPTLMKRADVAMYDAKKTHSRYAVYDPRKDEHSLRRLSLMMELRQAVAREELTLVFQPKIDCATDRVTHAEALVRWQHPAHGNLPPDEFIPLAEQSGNIGLITKWVLRKALVSCARWRDAGSDITVAVNLSALDLFDLQLPAFITGLLAEMGLPARSLVLEITESALMREPAKAMLILRELKQRGIALAIDDFGTGHSSLAHLKRMPVDELKIDKSFVMHLDDRLSDDFVIVRSTIELGHNMGLKVVAEGVETAQSWAILKALGCDMGQGYFMSRPLDGGAFDDYLKTAAQPLQSPQIAL